MNAAATGDSLDDVHGLGCRHKVSTHVAALFSYSIMGHHLLDSVALILSPLFVNLGRDELSKVGVANTDAGHPTLLEGRPRDVFLWSPQEMHPCHLSQRVGPLQG